MEFEERCAFAKLCVVVGRWSAFPIISISCSSVIIQNFCPFSGCCKRAHRRKVHVSQRCMIFLGSETPYETERSAILSILLELHVSCGTLSLSITIQLGPRKYASHQQIPLGLSQRSGNVFPGPSSGQLMSSHTSFMSTSESASGDLWSGLQQICLNVGCT